SSFWGCRTVSPRACASDFTAEAWGFRPRPAGRSGWVRTSAISWPASRRAESDLAANSGVPAKTSLMIQRGRRSAGRGVGGFRLPRLALLLSQPGVDAVLLEPGEVLDENLAFQMVHLVLDAHGEQPVGFQGVLRALRVQRPHLYALRA